MPQEILLIGKDTPKRLRMLSEFDEAFSIIMHDKFQVLFPQPCLKYYSEPCPFHNVEGIRTVTWYVWTVYDYENASKRIGLWKATLASPIEQLLDLYDANGTIKDRDIEMRKIGQGPKTRVKVKVLPVSVFEGKYHEPYKEDKIMEIVKGLITKKTIDVPAAGTTAEAEAPEEE